MKKQSIWSKPITWGGYAKLCGIATVIGAIVGAIEAIILYTDYPSKIMDWFRDKFHKEDEIDYE